MFVIFTILVFLIQGFNSELIDEIVSEMKPAIVFQKEQIMKAILNGGDEIGNTKAAIIAVVSTGMKNIENQIDRINQIIEEAQNEASETGKNIDECLINANYQLKLIDLSALPKCQSDVELNSLTIRLGELGIMFQKLSKLQDYCRDESRNCVDKIIEDAANKTERVKVIIASVCNDAKKNADVCVQQTLEELYPRVDEIAHNLKSCLLSILD